MSGQGAQGQGAHEQGAHEQGARENKGGACIVVHGGAGAHEMILLDPTYKQAKSEGTRKAATAGWKIMQEGGSAVDAVEAALVIMEDDPCFNAGIGGNLTRSGQVQMDAVLVDGRLDLGGVCGVIGIQNPIKLARTVKDKCETCMLYGEGAMQFSREHNITELPNSHFVTPVMQHKLQLWRDRQKPRSMDQEGLSHDTVGAVALDKDGNIAAGISTGGMCGMRDGRLGAGATIGAGCYAQDGGGGTSTSGYGDALMKTLLASDIVRRMGNGHTAQASSTAGVEAMQHLIKGGWGGAVCIDHSGGIGVAFTTKCMPWASVQQGGTLQYGVCPGELHAGELV